MADNTFEDKEALPGAPQATTPALTDPTSIQLRAEDRMEQVGRSALAGLDAVKKDDVSYGGTDAGILKMEAEVDKGSTYVSPEATVSGQLQTLLDADNAYMTNAKRRAQEQAASLGLLGSSMAVGATERAAIESAMPIAQQDAETYAKTALQEQQTKNEISRMKAESDLSAVAREHVYDIDAAKGKLNATFQQISESAKMQGNIAMEGAISEMQATWDSEVKLSLANLDAELQTQLNNNQITAAEAQWASEASAQVMAASYGSVNDLLGNADFMGSYTDEDGNVDTTGLAKVFNNFIGFGKDQVAFIGASAGLEGSYNDPTDGWLSYIGSWAA